LITAEDVGLAQKRAGDVIFAILQRTTGVGLRHVEKCRSVFRRRHEILGDAKYAVMGKTMSLVRGRAPAGNDF
jgi:hypothetical protein